VPAAGSFRVVALMGGLAGMLAAADGYAQAGAPHGLDSNAHVDVPVTAGATGLWLGSEILKGTLAPASCRVCERSPDGSDALNAVDAETRGALRWNDTETASVASDLTGFSLSPITALGMCEVAASADNRSREAPTNALVVFQAAALAADLDQVVKLLVARQRPFAHFRDAAAVGPRDPDENLSFYSGHTSLAFSLAVASGTIASMRGYRLAPAVWATSLPVAVVTGYLRIAADRHYLTDVLAGMVLGSAVGFLVPFVFHRAPDPGPAPAPVARRLGPAGGGPFFAASWTF
jgi:membrane-associated phospholipid phosphatase